MSTLKRIQTISFPWGFITVWCCLLELRPFSFLFIFFFFGLFIIFFFSLSLITVVFVSLFSSRGFIAFVGVSAGDLYSHNSLVQLLALWYPDVDDTIVFWKKKSALYNYLLPSKNSLCLALFFCFLTFFVPLSDILSSR